MGIEVSAMKVALLRCMICQKLVETAHIYERFERRLNVCPKCSGANSYVEVSR